MIDWIKCKIEGRSPKWRTVRKHLLNKNINCYACFRFKDLEVHHITPFKLRPDLELNEDNLIVLCKTCHFTFGHFSDYQHYNPEVKNDCMIHRIKLIANSTRIT